MAANDPIYAHLKTVALAGWTTRVWTPETEATRSEAALEVARVIFTVSARARADATWTAGASKPAARALRALIARLKPELLQLGVQTREPLALMSLVERAKASASTTATPPVISRPAKTLGGEEVPQQVRLATPFRFGNDARTNPPFANTPLEGRAPRPILSFSQRLRVETAALSLAWEARDRFDRHADARFRAGGGLSSRIGSVKTGASLDLAQWLTLRAAYNRQRLEKPAFGIRDDLLDSSERQSSVGGGVDVNALGVTLSGEVARLRTPGVEGNGVKVGGGVRVSAWQNRLTLAANLSRLLPEDASAFASSAAQLNVGLDVSQSVSLNLLYQQLFSATSQQRPERFVGGGISVNF